MIGKSLVAAAAVATSMAFALPVTQAEAKTVINVDVGFGYGYGYHHHKHKKWGAISCWKGAKIVDWSGFHNVHAVDCKLPGYKYTAWKKGHKYIVKVNGYGNIYSVHKIS
ncbi:MAG TPA: hypothetical protein P5337_04620 [Aestuariivirga sp.]|nr:hypothetical protein [Alphaproteobacteria bacterium]HRX35659.1 hypothetical protein [Aestuariivirga sp.]